MPTIKNVGGHVDDLHDGRPIARHATATVTAKDLDQPHYQHRLADGRFLVVPEPESAQRTRKTTPKTEEN